MSGEPGFVPTYDAVGIARAVASPLLILAGFAVLITVNFVVRQPDSSQDHSPATNHLRAFGLVFPGLVVGGFLNAVLSGEDAKTDRAFLLALTVYPIWTTAVLGLLYAFFGVIERHVTRATDGRLTLALAASLAVSWIFYYITCLDYVSAALNADIYDLGAWDWIWPAIALLAPGAVLAASRTLRRMMPRFVERILDRFPGTLGFRGVQNTSRFDQFQLTSIAVLLVGGIAFAAIAGFAPAFHTVAPETLLPTVGLLVAGSVSYSMYGLAICERLSQRPT